MSGNYTEKKSRHVFSFMLYLINFLFQKSSNESMETKKPTPIYSETLKEKEDISKKKFLIGQIGWRQFSITQLLNY